MIHRRTLAERYGYESGRCPRCGREMASDTSVFECRCGYESQPKIPTPRRVIAEDVATLFKDRACR